MSLDETILDDTGLIRLLKFPADVDLADYRNRRALPYRMFRHRGQVFYRYNASEVLKWFVEGQHKGVANGAEA